MKTHFKYIAITLCAVVIGAVAGVVVAKPQWLHADYWRSREGHAQHYFFAMVAAEKGDAASAQTAEAYARQWLDEHGRGEVYYGLAYAYQTGKNNYLPVNEAKAQLWMQRSADSGYLPAEQVMYNQHVNKTHPLPMPVILRYTTDMAEHGDAAAQFYLAGLYLRGGTIPRNPQKAFDWASKSAAQGNTGAKKLLRILHQQGIGTRPNIVEAQRLETQLRDKGVHFTKSRGSAFSPVPGMFVTNNHVVAGCKELKGEFNNIRFPLEVVTVTADQDLALLRSNDAKAANVGTVAIAPDYEMQRGEPIFSAGYSTGALTVKPATVLSPHEHATMMIDGKPATYDFIVFSASVNHGDSGGPIVDTSGKVIAVTNAGAWRMNGDKKELVAGMGIVLGELRALLAPHLVAYSLKSFHKPEKLSQSNRQKLEQATIQVWCAS